MRGKKSRYKGYTLKSRAERLVAEDLDKQGIRWVYEPTLFKLPSGGYIPDFYLLSSKVWIEVKAYVFPRDLTGEESKKLYYLNREVSSKIYLALPYHGFVGEVSYYLIENNSSGIMWTETPVKAL